MASAYSTGLTVRKIPTIFLKNSSLKKKYKDLHNGKTQSKLASWLKRETVYFQGKKNPNVISLQVFFVFWTSDKNLETHYRVSNITLTLV